MVASFPISPLHRGVCFPWSPHKPGQVCQLIKPKEEMFNEFVLLLKREQLPSQPCPLRPLSYESMDFFMLLEGLLAFPVCVCQPHSPKSRAEFGVIRVVLGRINSLGSFVLPGAGVSVQQPWEGRLAVTFGRAVRSVGCWGVVSGQVPGTHLSLGCPTGRGWAH